MTDSELDAAYTLLCNTLTRIGEPDGPLFLARFALLAITRMDDPEAIKILVDAAADSLTE